MVGIKRQFSYRTKESVLDIELDICYVPLSSGEYAIVDLRDAVPDQGKEEDTKERLFMRNLVYGEPSFRKIKNGTVLNILKPKRRRLLHTTSYQEFIKGEFAYQNKVALEREEKEG